MSSELWIAQQKEIIIVMENDKKKLEVGVYIYYICVLPKRIFWTKVCGTETL